ncbi:hypothetical protein GPECTOR_4g880 [Gonium pectorale]|uniref:Uncharacterized protein n=1 Tax=Gonium pectorale TaxID=33097 RepID=A0A150GY97_GONPE|nr:hypothetical protein GPECTOR_4g880 [Gonium pectorale]|eukprot:KXZ54809.1 hypothetical protein GPECTOR_4g880 [Gonium pectorale]
MTLILRSVGGADDSAALFGANPLHTLSLMEAPAVQRLRWELLEQLAASVPAVGCSGDTPRGSVAALAVAAFMAAVTAAAVSLEPRSRGYGRSCWSMTP